MLLYDAQSIVRSLAAGMDYYMTNPCDPKWLIQEITTLLEHHAII